MRKSGSYGSLLLAILVFALAFSTHVNGQLAKGKSKFLGNTHTKGQTPINFDMYWNQVTPGNAGKWASCEQARDDFNYWLWCDRAYDHARQVGFVFKEHTLVWGHSSGEPSWMSSVPRDEQMDEVLEWYEAFAERYPDVEMIDVVNEPLHAPPSYKDALGGDGTTGWDWVIWCYEKARDYFPDAILILNDYNILNYTSDCQRFLVIVRLLQARGLIDAIGCQGHSLENIAFSTIQQNMDSLAATGLDIYISEYEARGNDSTQLALFRQHFPYFWEHASVKGITLWGYLEGDMWRPEAHLLKADGVTERPALQWLKQYFNYSTDNTRYRFATDVEGQGSISLSPAGGVYDPFTTVTATAVAGNGYRFSHWTGDKGGSENPATMAMTSNRLLRAHFVSTTPIKGPVAPGKGTIGIRVGTRVVASVKVRADKSMSVSLYSLTGRLVVHYKGIIVSNGYIDLSAAVAGGGMYLLHVKADGKKVMNMVMCGN
ncbi:MAG: endo-1,4-beta-xylanase [Chitinispirillaceae bacterium]|nr:endo-1,4-beta-xylanase [Chitinispirillaceae bacterium]